mmetsp:Transcript_86712/g.280748  ORF Transcript_86712/g.280748 Transcript_86712/m.280748 type:complete len:263 (-) Transcript_86712:202-990(-)
MCDLYHLPHYIEAKRLRVLVPLAIPEQEWDSGLHGLLCMLHQPCLCINHAQGKIPEHAHQRFHRRLNLFLHIVHQLHHDCPEVLEDECNIRPCLPSEERLSSLDCGLARRDACTPKRQDEVLRDEGPLARKLAGEVLRGLHAEVACSELDDCVAQWAVGVEEVGVELRPQLLRAELLPEAVRQAGGLQVQGLPEHLARPDGARRLVQQADKEGRVLQLAREEHQVPQELDPLLRRDLQGVRARGLLPVLHASLRVRHADKHV